MTLIFSFSQICYAQETAPSVEAEAQVATKESTKNSQEERLDKNFSILVGYGYELVIDAIHLNLGYFINPNLILELKVAHEKEENNNSYSKIKEVTVVSIGPKFFVANSFYVKPSFEYLKLKNNFISIDSFFDGSSDYEELEGYGASAVIGNQWQFKSFTLGVDWIGVKKVISTNSRGNPENYYFNLLVGYLGVSF